MGINQTCYQSAGIIAEVASTLILVLVIADSRNPNWGLVVVVYMRCVQLSITGDQGARACSRRWCAQSLLESCCCCCSGVFRYRYIHASTPTAAVPNPPDDTKPAVSSATVMAAGTSTGLKITSNGVATMSASTVAVSASPDSSSMEKAASTLATAAAADWCCCWP
jgi:hypothetical protein